MVDPISAIIGGAAVLAGLGALYGARISGKLAVRRDANVVDVDQFTAALSAMQRAEAVRNDMSEAEER